MTLEQEWILHGLGAKEGVPKTWKAALRRSVSCATLESSYCQIHPFLLVVTISEGSTLVTHAYNPSYSGGVDQEDLGSKPTWASSIPDPILKIPYTKTGLVEWLKW
jgi:hypothetical protein